MRGCSTPSLRGEAQPEALRPIATTSVHSLWPLSQVSTWKVLWDTTSTGWCTLFADCAVGATRAAQTAAPPRTRMSLPKLTP